jgi:hypothetical protein
MDYCQSATGKSCMSYFEDSQQFFTFIAPVLRLQGSVQ